MHKKIRCSLSQLLKYVASLTISCLVSVQVVAGTPLVHDAEYYVLEKQNGERWSVEDKDLDLLHPHR
jgi:arylsulfatase